MQKKTGERAKQPSLVGRIASAFGELDERILSSPGRSLVVVTCLLIIIGILNIHSATSAEANANGSAMSGYVWKYMVALAIGMGLASGVYHKGYLTLKIPRVMYITVIALLLSFGAVLAFGPIINGARRWISIAGISFQPSEFAKLVGVIWSAYWCEALVRKKYPITWTSTLGAWRKIRNGTAKREEFGHQFCTSILVLMPLVFALFTVGQPDTGTAVLIVAFSFLVWLAGGMDRRNLKYALILLGIALVVIFLLLHFHIAESNYRLARVRTWYDPFTYKQNEGYQMVQSLYAVASGGFWGQGFLDGTAKYFYLPEAHTDFAFAIWAQEWGFLGALVVMILFLFFIRIGMVISRQCYFLYGRLLAFGITIVIGFQAMFNMLMACGFMPVTGVPLPFISYGGSAAIMNLICVGILLSIAKHNEKERTQRALRGEPDVPLMRDETRSRFIPPKG